MTRSCPECGADLAGFSDCRGLFHQLLGLESQMPVAPGELPHFLAVASYNLQHPSTFAVAALTGLRKTVADVLAGRATVAETRRRARQGRADGMRVSRRPDERLSADNVAVLAGWPSRWPLMVADVARVDPEDYVEAVQRWAESVSAALEGSRGQST